MFLFFEVMDKHPGAAELWAILLVAGVAGFLLGRVNPLLLLLVLPFTLLFSLVHYWELNDPYMGKSIIREAGYGYVVQSYMAMIIGNALPAAGFFAWLLRKEKTPS